MKLHTEAYCKTCHGASLETTLQLSWQTLGKFPGRELSAADCSASERHTSAATTVRCSVAFRFAQSANLHVNVDEITAKPLVRVVSLSDDILVMKNFKRAASVSVSMLCQLTVTLGTIISCCCLAQQNLSWVSCCGLENTQCHQQQHKGMFRLVRLLPLLCLPAAYKWQAFPSRTTASPCCTSYPCFFRSGGCQGGLSKLVLKDDGKC